ncbi:hypothetical protein JIN84_19950 [Luteolibacter yonseiensis]|uniref:Uncharacterized protein n=1 Tax=Luteolibacter yonseiensis TaxID=1144680 RepID=A0A934R9F2_9BACT|nr:hypothetical protein [Luteolibacter yonseiensis]MBK1817905.1 hypothetical protein [Luteolibacter yonseiensis]
MKNVICVLLVEMIFFSLARAQVTVSPDTPPRHWMEQVPDTTGTRDIVSLVFKTTPGVLYSVQTSEDLTHWQTLDDEFYGLGQEVVIPMIAKNPRSGHGRRWTSIYGAASGECLVIHATGHRRRAAAFLEVTRYRQRDATLFARG